MNIKEARSIISLWNQVIPRDPIERDARWVHLNQSIGFIEGYEAGVRDAAKEAGDSKGSLEACHRILKLREEGKA